MDCKEAPGNTLNIYKVFRWRSVGTAVALRLDRRT
jgi:hypothetical protein